jgi:hypothetical protein
MSNTINKFKNHIVSGGYFIASLYTVERHPDVVLEIDKLISAGWTQVYKDNEFIVIQKP